jgi:hypothetical protein
MAAAGQDARRNFRFGSDLARSPSRRRMAGVCAHRTAGIDVKQTLLSRSTKAQFKREIGRSPTMAMLG